MRFFPVVNWAERGNFGDGNSVPRFHLTWGTGKALVEAVWGAIESHPRRAALEVRFGARVTELLVDEQGGVLGVRVLEEDWRGGRGGARSDPVVPGHQAGRENGELRATKAVVIAAGGIGGNHELVRRVWPTAELGSPPAKMLMGSHPYADGALHEEVERVGGAVTHLERMWNYADAVRHPAPQRPDHGLKLIPPRSGVMLDPDGRRYGPVPVMPTYDAYAALERMCEDERKYSWLICNRKIARRELDVSGSQHNPHLRERRWVRFALGRAARQTARALAPAGGLARLRLRRLAARAGGADERGDGRSGDRPRVLAAEIGRYDESIARGKGLFNDDQLRRIAQLRNWRGDRLRTCAFQQILDPKAGPLIAIRLQVMARKSLGGIQTDLACRVLRAEDGGPIPGLYAVGEAAGFGGGGMHGKRSLEGTFLGGCVFTGRLAAAAIAGTELPQRIPPRVDAPRAKSRPRVRPRATTARVGCHNRAVPGCTTIALCPATTTRPSDTSRSTCSPTSH